MKVVREDLIIALRCVKPGLGRKSIIEQSPHFIFTGESIVSYNDQICISYPFKTDFKCSIPADEFYDVLFGIDQTKVDIDFLDNRLSIKAKGVSASLLSSIEERIVDLVSNLNLDKIEWHPLPDDFLEGISFCIFSASKDITEPILSCIGISRNKIISSDNPRISEYTMKEDIGESFLVPARYAGELVKFDGKEGRSRLIKFAIGDSWVFFGSKEGVVFSSRVLKEKYYDIKDYFDFEYVSIKLPDNLKSAVEYVSLLAEGEFDIDKKIDVEIKGGKIKCKGERDVGWIENELDIRNKKEERMKFSINPIFFSQVLEKTRRMYCGEDRVMLRTRRFKHLMLLSME